jgi:hypothetical protein
MDKRKVLVPFQVSMRFSRKQARHEEPDPLGQAETVEGRAEAVEVSVMTDRIFATAGDWAVASDGLQ